MPAPGRVRFAELHLHLYGTIRAEDYLEHVEHREVDWTRYEASYEQAYGGRPPVREILERHRAGDPAAAGHWKELFVFGDEDAGNFKRFQAKFDLLVTGSELSRLHTYDDPLPPLERELRFFLERMLADQRRQDIGYAEQRVLLGPRFPMEQVRHFLGIMLDEYAEATRTGLTARLALSLDRADPWPHWELVQELALGPRGESLTGIDFCHVEEGFPPKDKAELFRSVQDFNARHPERALAVLYHVGESFVDKTLESAVRWVQEAAELGADRLGHAIALGVDPACYGEHDRSESAAERRDQLRYDLAHDEGLRKHGVRIDRAALQRELDALRAVPDAELLQFHYDAARLAEVRARQDYAMERVRASGAVVEVCPSSNLRIGAIDDPAHHPVHRFLEHGVPFVVGSDDPGIFDTTVERELDWVIARTGLDAGARDELVAASWRQRSEVISGRERA
jgi:adenosine deaminase